MKPKLAIFLNHPECSAHCAVGMYKSLFDSFKPDIFNKTKLNTKFLKRYDMVAFPGGIGDSDTFDKLVRPNMESVVEYVETGGRYLGVCMGAYWAGHHYFNILNGVKCEQYIKRPGADVRRSFGTTTPVTWNSKLHHMYFYDGCSLIGNETKFTTVARYVNGDPMAIIQNRIGVIGCHPESDSYWYETKKMKQYWHNGVHHKLLEEFALTLMKQ